MQDSTKLERYSEIVKIIFSLDNKPKVVKLPVHNKLVSNFMKLNCTELSEIAISKNLYAYIDCKLQDPGSIRSAAKCLPNGSKPKIVMDLLTHIWDNLE